MYDERKISLGGDRCQSDKGCRAKRRSPNSNKNRGKRMW